ncbi:hypothetical protein A0257_15250 [Hymenobacter psoromatis]|nr:hypothetical protein A0257_15250 [Hymenobacter psoromatis]
MTSATSPGSNKTGRYVFLALLAIPVLGLLYYLFSYLAVNLFLGLDLSAYGRVGEGGWPGYALLGLGLGAAGGALAARRRYRLHQGLVWGAAAGAVGLAGLAIATFSGAPAADQPAATEAKPYKPLNRRVTCGTCTAIMATTTRPAQNDNSYEVSNLLQRDTLKAWISGTATDAANPLLPETRLSLTIGPLAGHRLVGLRLRNGYCKNSGVYQGFSRAKTCQLRSADGTQSTIWALPDTEHREFFLPLASPAVGPDSARLTLSITETYPGATHSEVALAWLVPLFEPLTQGVSPKPAR